MIKNNNFINTVYLREEMAQVGQGFGLEAGLQVRIRGAQAQEAAQHRLRVRVQPFAQDPAQPKQGDREAGILAAPGALQELHRGPQADQCLCGGPFPGRAEQGLGALLGADGHLDPGFAAGRSRRGRSSRRLEPPEQGDQRRGVAQGRKGAVRIQALPQPGQERGAEIPGGLVPRQPMEGRGQSGHSVERAFPGQPLQTLPGAVAGGILVAQALLQVREEKAQLRIPGPAQFRGGQGLQEGPRFLPATLGGQVPAQAPGGGLGRAGGLGPAE